jgi:alkylresorcinol/alkylpyrone synthase
VDGFLGRHRRTVADLSHFAIHPGGAKILESMSESLHISADRLELSRAVLEEYGNMSSPTVLFILKRLLENGGAGAGDHGLAAAFGPGFSSELLLLKW